MAGKVPVCNAAMIERLCTAISVGMKWTEAAEASGVSARAFREWRARGQREPGTPFAELNERLVEAEARFEETHLGRIVAAATERPVTTIITEKRGRDGETIKETKTTVGVPLWTPSAWLLERTRPERYALINRIETGPAGAFDGLGDKELTAAILELVPKRHPRRKKGDDGEREAG